MEQRCLSRDAVRRCMWRGQSTLLETIQIGRSCGYPVGLTRLAAHAKQKNLISAIPSVMPLGGRRDDHNPGVMTIDVKSGGVAT